MAPEEAGKGEGWYLLWTPGGRIRLVHSTTEVLRCPQCRAPVLHTADRVVCYACGMTFNAGEATVWCDFGKHEWKDSECGARCPYDPHKPREYYESIGPGKFEPESDSKP